MNKSPAFILNILGWNKENIAQQFENRRPHPENKMECGYQPDVALNLLSTPIASVVDENW